MARFAVSAALLLMTTTAAHAQEDPQLMDGLSDAAAESGVSEQDLLGALNTLADAGIPTTPAEYLCAADGLLCPPAPAVTHAPIPPPAPVATGTSARVACIEAKESGGANVANRRGSGAVGVMQYMPRTFYAHAAEMGHPSWSPWNPAQARAVAAHDLALGRRAQWTVQGCP